MNVHAEAVQVIEARSSRSVAILTLVHPIFYPMEAQIQPILRVIERGAIT